MEDKLWGFIFGGFAGGLVAFLGKGAQKWFVDFRLTEAVEARKRITQYSNPLWLDCHELRYRLIHILQKRRNGADAYEMGSLTDLPRDGDKPLEWYTKDGYYITSTAYLISAVSCWIQILEREIVFLRFSKKSLTAKFFSLVEGLKQEFSNEDSPLYYYYFSSIGEQMISDTGKRTLGISEFIFRLYRDKEFSEFYDQLFQYIRFVATNTNEGMILRVTDKLAEIMEFLEVNGAVPVGKSIPEYTPAPEIC